jgi:hypothetical protein
VNRAMGSCVRTFGDQGDAQDPNRPYTYTHTTGESYRVAGIFESATETVDLDTGVNTLSYTPRLSLALSELQKNPVAGDRIQIRGQWFRVAEPEHDGQGNVTLRLHESTAP